MEGCLCSFLSWEEIKEIEKGKNIKNKFDIEINDSSKKNCMFVDEIIRN